MKSQSAEILYVGKAKVLKNRVTSYFQPALHSVLRTELMVTSVVDFDIILTETESEALILECTLIKKHKPRYNIRLKDDKTYPYLRIPVFDDFPKIEWTRKPKKDGARYFGPFPSAFSAKQVLKLLNDTYQLRDCSDNTFRHRSRACILHQMGKCTAPCVQLITRDQYHEQINEVVEVLSGKTEKIIGDLERGMHAEAEQLHFEEAAHYRDQIQNLKLITETQVVLDTQYRRTRDVVSFARKDGLAHGVILQIRDGKMMGVKHYTLTNTENVQSESEVLFHFLSQHYLLEKAHTTEDTPFEIQSVLMGLVPEDLELLEKTTRLNFLVAENEDDKKLLNVAFQNANYALEKAVLTSDKGHGFEALEEVKEKLNLLKIPTRIECYDISNFLGQDAVASRVVFINGAPDKNLYRRYKIKTVFQSDDFAMMREVLSRRFSNTNEDLPDLVVIDGGLGQLSQATAIFDELSVQGVEVVGLAKARVERDYKSKEVESSRERIFIPKRKNPVPLLPHQKSYKLLTHVRDEAHRFAINYHRKLRDKRSMASEEE